MKKNWKEKPTTTRWQSCAITSFLLCKKKLKKYKKKLNEKPNRLLQEEVDENLIAHIVSKWTGIPINKMLEGEAQRLLHLEKSWKSALSARLLSKLSAKPSGDRALV